MLSHLQRLQLLLAQPAEQRAQLLLLLQPPPARWLLLLPWRACITHLEFSTAMQICSAPWLTEVHISSEDTSGCLNNRS